MCLACTVGEQAEWWLADARVAGTGTSPLPPLFLFTFIYFTHLCPRCISAVPPASFLKGEQFQNFGDRFLLRKTLIKLLQTIFIALVANTTAFWNLMTQFQLEGVFFYTNTLSLRMLHRLMKFAKHRWAGAVHGAVAVATRRTNQPS